MDGRAFGSPKTATHTLRKTNSFRFCEIKRTVALMISVTCWSGSLVVCLKNLSRWVSWSSTKSSKNIVSTLPNQTVVKITIWMEILLSHASLSCSRDWRKWAENENEINWRFVARRCGSLISGLRGWKQINLNCYLCNNRRNIETVLANPSIPSSISISIHFWQF